MNTGVYILGYCSKLVGLNDHQNHSKFSYIFLANKMQWM